MIIAFIRLCLPYILPGSLPAGSGEGNGRFSRRFLAWLPGWGAGCPAALRTLRGQPAGEGWQGILWSGNVTSWTSAVLLHWGSNSWCYGNSRTPHLPFEAYNLRKLHLGNQIYFTSIHLTYESCSIPLEEERKIGYYWNIRSVFSSRRGWRALCSFICRYHCVCVHWHM